MPHHETVSSHIPETRFKCLTIGIISMSLTVGLLVPNIELVLGLVGSTIGVLICVMFPAVAFISISTKSSQERLLAQVTIYINRPKRMPVLFMILCVLYMPDLLLSINVRWQSVLYKCLHC